MIGKKRRFKKTPPIRWIRNYISNGKRGDRNIHQGITRKIPHEEVIKFNKLKNNTNQKDKIELEKIILRSTFNFLRKPYDEHLLDTIATQMVAINTRAKSRIEFKQFKQDLETEKLLTKLVETLGGQSNYSQVREFFEIMLYEYEKKASKLKANQQ